LFDVAGGRFRPRGWGIHVAGKYSMPYELIWNGTIRPGASAAAKEPLNSPVRLTNIGFNIIPSVKPAFRQRRRKSNFLS
jgi:hypothetical protein